MPMPLIAVQWVLIAAGFAMGGPSTAVGGSLLLAAISCFGIACGWAARGRKGGA